MEVGKDFSPKRQVARAHTQRGTEGEKEDALRDSKSTQEAITFSKPQLVPRCHQHKGLSLVLESEVSPKGLTQFPGYP